MSSSDFQLEERERELLPTLTEFVEGLLDDTVDKLILYIVGIEEGRKILEPIISQEEALSRHKARVRAFLQDFFRDPFSERVIERAFRVGIVHAEMGVKPPLLRSALYSVWDFLRDHLSRTENPALQQGLNLYPPPDSLKYGRPEDI